MSKEPDVILKAKTQLLLHHPFFAVLFLKLKCVEDNTIPTASTNGKDIKYNGDWFRSLEVDEVQGVFAHEVFHVALGHVFRIGKRDPKRWNDAIDYAVNLLLYDAGMTLPRGDYGWLNDEQYRGMTAEHIYDLLPSDPNGPGRSGESPGMGDVYAPTNDQGQPLTEGEIKQQESQWKMAMNHAMKTAKDAGKMPACLTDLIDKLTESQIPWQERLKQYMMEPAKGDYTWSRPNRRFIHSGLILPSNYTHGLGTIIWVTDSSGSVGDDEFKAFGGEFNAIVQDAEPDAVWSMFCDTKLSSIKEHRPEDFPINEIRPTGRGGTHFNAPFDWVEEQGIQPACLIYLTDLYGDCTISPPNYPVIWVSTTHKGQDDVNFGVVINIKV